MYASRTAPESEILVHPSQIHRFVYRTGRWNRTRWHQSLWVTGLGKMPEGCSVDEQRGLDLLKGFAVGQSDCDVIVLVQDILCDGVKIGQRYSGLQDVSDYETGDSLSAKLYVQHLWFSGNPLCLQLPEVQSPLQYHLLECKSHLEELRLLLDESDFTDVDSVQKYVEWRSACGEIIRSCLVKMMDPTNKKLFDTYAAESSTECCKRWGAKIPPAILSHAQRHPEEGSRHGGFEPGRKSSKKGWYLGNTARVSQRSRAWPPGPYGAFG